MPDGLPAQQVPAILFHLTARADWEAAVSVGEYRLSTVGVRLEDEGFIHASRAEQVPATAERYFATVDDLVLVAVETSALDVPVVMEGGFPHIYGPVPMAAVLAVRGYRRRPEGFPVVRHVRKVRPGAYALVVEQGHLLLCRFIARYGGSWTMPGGGIDLGESTADALIREVFEETGIDVEVGAAVTTWSRRLVRWQGDTLLQDVRTIALFRGRSLVGLREPVVHDIDGSTDAARWVPIDDLDSVPRELLAWLSINAAREAGMLGQGEEFSTPTDS